MNARYYIDNLNLKPHPEGGYYKETFVNNFKISNNNGDKRGVISNIYFLIEENNHSAFHQIQSDETWYFHDGSPLIVYAIDLEGKIHEYKIGLDIKNGQLPQITIPAKWIFCATTKGSYAFVSCSVAPAFDFKDFKLYEKDELQKFIINDYSKKIIEKYAFKRT